MFVLRHFAAAPYYDGNPPQSFRNSIPSTTPPTISAAAAKSYQCTRGTV